MSCVLRSDGLYEKEWDGHRKEYDVQKLPPDRLMTCWNESLEIDKGVRLGDLLDLLIHLPQPSYDLLCQMTRRSIARFIAYDLSSLPTADSEQDLSFIEMYKYVETSDHDEKLPHPTIQVCTGIHGVYKTPQKREFDEGEDATCAIEFTPWNQLVDVPLRVRKEVSMSSTTWKTVPEHNVFANSDLLKSHRDIDEMEEWTCLDQDGPTLGEFVCALVDELCFFASPEDRDGSKEELMDLKAEVERKTRDATDAAHAGRDQKDLN